MAARNEASAKEPKQARKSLTLDPDKIALGHRLEHFPNHPGEEE